MEQYAESFWTDADIDDCGFCEIGELFIRTAGEDGTDSWR